MAIWAALAAILSSIFAGTTLVAFRFIIIEVEPLTITILRVGIGAAILLPVALIAGRGWPRGGDLWRLVALGIVMFAISQWLVSGSVQYTTAARAGILAATVPFLTLAMAAAVGAERLTWPKSLGVGLAISGVMLALWKDASAIEGGWRGDLLMVAGSAVLAAYTIASRRLVRRYSLLVYVICNMVPGIAVLWLIAQASGIPSIPVALLQHSWFVVLYIGVFGGVGTYFMWLWALRHTTPTRAAVAITLNPLAAIIGGAVVLGEPVTAGVVAGLGCVIGGIVLPNWQTRPVQPAKIL